MICCRCCWLANRFASAESLANLIVTKPLVLQWKTCRMRAGWNVENNNHQNNWRDSSPVIFFCCMYFFKYKSKQLCELLTIKIIALWKVWKMKHWHAYRLIPYLQNWRTSRARGCFRRTFCWKATYSSYPMNITSPFLGLVASLRRVSKILRLARSKTASRDLSSFSLSVTAYLPGCRLAISCVGIVCTMLQSIAKPLRTIRSISRCCVHRIRPKLPSCCALARLSRWLTSLTVSLHTSRRMSWWKVPLTLRGFRCSQRSNNQPNPDHSGLGYIFLLNQSYQHVPKLPTNM